MKIDPVTNAFNVAADTMESYVNDRERPFTEQERRDIVAALNHLRKHVAHLSLFTNVTLGIATLAGFLMGIIFAKVTL